MTGTSATTYTCAACGRTFESDRSDAEALAESRLIWGDIPPEEQIVICDDCFERGFATAHAEHEKGRKPS